MSSATPSESSTNAADSAGAAALLRAHGITLLPADRGCTVLTALRSGRTVVLSDAGKLMLKESSNTTTDPQIVVNNTIASSNTDNSAMDISSANTNTNSANIATVNTNNANIGAVTTNSVNNANVGIVSANSAGIKALRTVRPGKNVKVLTLNKPQQPLKKIIHPSDLQQVKVVQVAGAGGAKSRPALKLLLNKVNLQRLLSSSVTQPVTQELPAETSMEVDELNTSVSDEASLREQLAAARTTIASMAAELRACRAKLAMYEKDQPR